MSRPADPLMSASDPTLLAAVLRRCAHEEGGLRALARAIGVSPQTLYELIGGRLPGKHVLRAVALYLEVSPGEVAMWARQTEA